MTVEVHLGAKRWRADAIRAIAAKQDWTLVATGRKARRLNARLESLLAGAKLGLIEFAWLFTLGAFPAVFFYAKGMGFNVQRVPDASGSEVVLKFTLPSAAEHPASRQRP